MAVTFLTDVDGKEFDSRLRALEFSPEPAEDDIPKVFFGASLPQTKDDTIMSFRYISKTEDISGYCKTKAQGNSSMSYPKKNQTVALYKDAACTEKLNVNFKGWGEQNKFCFKANWNDLTHARNIVSARLWGDVVKSRDNYEDIPEPLRTSPNQGAVDGFPVKVYADGIYQGRYTLNIPKDAWMANMDEAQDTHCILCGENYVSGCFRAEANIDGFDWTDEIHDTVPENIKTSFNNAIRFVMSSTDEMFARELGHYFDVDSLIDYYIFAYASCGLDSLGKNQLMLTYDGIHWIAGMYDMDSTWGLYPSGWDFVSPEYRMQKDYEPGVHGTSNLLYERLEKLFSSRIAERWNFLKQSVLSLDNIMNHFERFTDICPPHLVQEDYAETTAEGAFTGIPSKDNNNIQQIREYVRRRLAYTEFKINRVACTGIALSARELTFTEATAQTLTATILPEGCSDDVVWSSSLEAVATVANGVVMPKSNGNCVITVTCGDYSASCNVTISAFETASNPVYSLADAVLDGKAGIDTGVRLGNYDAYTVLLDYTVIPFYDSYNRNSILDNSRYTGDAEPGWHFYVASWAEEGEVLCQEVTNPQGTRVHSGSISGHRHRMAIKMTADKTTVLYSDDKYPNGTDISHTILNTSYDCGHNLLIGQWNKYGGEGDQWAKMTVHLCEVYDEAISDERITEFLNG